MSMTPEEYALWDELGAIPQDRLNDAHFCDYFDWALMSVSFEHCLFCGGPEIGPQKSPSSVPAIEAQTKQLAAELESGDLP